MEPSKLKKFLSYWTPVIFWAGLIFYFSSIPNLETSSDPFLDNILRNLAHVLVYFIFSLLWLRALSFLSSKQKKYYTLGVVFLYSLSDEIHQYFVPTRSFQFLDLFTDNFGSLLAVYTINSILPQAPEHFKKLAKKCSLI